MVVLRQGKYLLYNKHAASYAWKRLPDDLDKEMVVLDMQKTLEVCSPISLATDHISLFALVQELRSDLLLRCEWTTTRRRLRLCVTQTTRVTASALRPAGEWGEG